MRSRMLFSLLCVAAVLCQISINAQAPSQAIPASLDLSQETEFTVELLGPLSTETSHAGDTITAKVLSPDVYNTGFLEGRVKKSVAGHGIKPKAELSFYFDTLKRGDASMTIDSVIKTYFNSKGLQDADEEGMIVAKKNNLGKAAAMTAAGGVIGGLLGGGKGAAIGAGVGAAAALVVIKVDAAKISFQPGSRFVVSVKRSRSGQQ